jgi:hypothetical protein
MPKCKHQNGELLEILQAAHSYELKAGTLDNNSYMGIGDILGYEFFCVDCAKTWKFKYAPRPKWLKAVFNQLVT